MFPAASSSSHPLLHQPSLSDRVQSPAPGAMPIPSTFEGDRITAGAVAHLHADQVLPNARAERIEITDPTGFAKATQLDHDARRCYSKAEYGKYLIDNAGTLNSLQRADAFEFTRLIARADEFESMPEIRAELLSVLSQRLGVATRRARAELTDTAPSWLIDALTRISFQAKDLPLAMRADPMRHTLQAAQELGSTPLLTHCYLVASDAVHDLLKSEAISSQGTRRLLATLTRESTRILPHVGSNFGSAWDRLLILSRRFAYLNGGNDGTSYARSLIKSLRACPSAERLKRLIHLAVSDSTARMRDTESFFSNACNLVDKIHDDKQSVARALTTYAVTGERASLVNLSTLVESFGSLNSDEHAAEADFAFAHFGALDSETKERFINHAPETVKAIDLNYRLAMVRRYAQLVPSMPVNAFRHDDPDDTPIGPLVESLEALADHQQSAGVNLVAIAIMHLSREKRRSFYSALSGDPEIQQRYRTSEQGLQALFEGYDIAANALRPD